MADVIFKSGTRDKFDALQPKDPNAIYWLTDTQEIYRGDQLFGVGAEATDTTAGLLSAADKAKLDKLTVSGLTGLTPVDGSIKIGNTEDGELTVGVAISTELNNILSIKDDGLFATFTHYTIEKQSDSDEGFAATYKLKKISGSGHEEYVGDPINIPKDLVIKNGTFGTATEAGKPYADAEVGDPYIDLELNDLEGSHIYIPLKGLVDNVEAGQGITVENNTVSILLDGNNSNGLMLGDNGLGLALATLESAGAMSAADKKFIDAIPMLYEKKNYEFSSLPDGSLVNSNGKEYRVMCPADTVWKSQNGGGGNPNYKADRYYISMKAYAPNDSVTRFRESVSPTDEKVTDETLYTFTPKDFGGVDDYGRKYSIIWLPVAGSDEDGKWSYYGAKSGEGKYPGWYYNVEWCDDDGNVIASDTIRINLSNEACHTASLPYYMSKYATTEDIKNIGNNLEWEEL